MIDNLRHQGLRKRMVDYLHVKRGIDNQDVLKAMNIVPRHLFLDSSFLEFAYEDKAFPIGSDQTISSLYTVAFQTQLLDVSPGETVLEIGTGSGYQTAVLAQLKAKIYSIERHRILYKKAKTLLSKLNYRANLVYGDGYLGLHEKSPFDKILVTCGAAELPKLLVDQLKPGGHMVVPIGFKNQIMTKICKDIEGNLSQYEYENFQFVPMLRDKA
tara:strand:- start:211 stop:852 length:642 start_codon:yes stop_codon:yes gene_type:complete